MYEYMAWKINTHWMYLLNILSNEISFSEGSLSNFSERMWVCVKFCEGFWLVKRGLGLFNRSYLHCFWIKKNSLLWIVSANLLTKPHKRTTGMVSRRCLKGERLKWGRKLATTSTRTLASVRRGAHASYCIDPSSHSMASKHQGDKKTTLA